MPNFVVGSVRVMPGSGDYPIADIFYPCHALENNVPLCGYERHQVIEVQVKWNELLDFQQCPNCRRLIGALRAQNSAG